VRGSRAGSERHSEPWGRIDPQNTPEINEISIRNRHRTEHATNMDLRNPFEVGGKYSHRCAPLRRLNLAPSRKDILKNVEKRLVSQKDIKSSGEISIALSDL
jgi:hypothetical protein